MNNKMIEMPVTVEVYRQYVCVSVALAERLPLLVATSQFRARNSLPVSRATYDRAVEQLGLRQRATAWGQRRSIPAGSRKRQQHGRHRFDDSRPGALRHSDLQRVTSSPVEDPLRSRRL